MFKSKKANPPTVVSLFCGAGGLDLGFTRAGFDILYATDNVEDATESYKRNLHKNAVCVDIRDLDLSSLPKCDVVIGGPPCQGFSVAGKMNLTDPRSKLVFSFLGVVEEIRPKIFVMENVPHLATSPKFVEVRRLIRKTAKRLGYGMVMWKLNAKHYGVPQSRERVFFIGYLPVTKTPKAPVGSRSIITAGEVLRTLPAAGVAPNLGVCPARIVPAKNPVLRTSPFAGMLFNGQGRPINLEDVANTLPATMGGNRTPIIDEKLLYNRNATSWISKYHAHRQAGRRNKWEVPAHIRRITVTEAALLQGFPVDHCFMGTQCVQYRLIGNAVPPPLGEAVAQAVKLALL